jgi:hypothetical protein
MTKESKKGIVTDPSANEELLALIDRILTGEITTAEIEEILLGLLELDGTITTVDPGAAVDQVTTSGSGSGSAVDSGSATGSGNSSGSTADSGSDSGTGSGSTSGSGSTTDSGGSAGSAGSSASGSTAGSGSGSGSGTGSGSSSGTGSTTDAPATPPDPWTLVAIPDTQYSTLKDVNLEYATAMTQWVVDNSATENIRFVAHEGDLVQRDKPYQWERIDGVMGALDGVVPYATAIGDHDYAVEEDRASGSDSYSKWFGVERFAGYDWFGGGSDTDRSHYQYFSAGGYDFLHLNLDWEAPGAAADPSTELGWAQSVLDDHPDLPAIVTTHSYIWDKPGQEGRTDFIEEMNGDGSSGETIWTELVEPNPQVFMVLCGNFHKAKGTDDGEWHQVSQNEAGLDVYEMLADYQDRPDGGEGWFRLVRFEPGAGTDGLDRISVRTYSPKLDEYQTDVRSEFHFDLSFAERFATALGGTPPTGTGTGAGAAVETVAFQQGVDGYAGAEDTFLEENDPQVDHAEATVLLVDDDSPQWSGQKTQALVKFGALVGSDPGQVPAGATVTEAVLELDTVDPGDGANLHRMIYEWSPTETWATALNGIALDDVQAVSTPDATVESAALGPTYVDVTQSVQEWVTNEGNRGWVFEPLGDEGWGFGSAEGTVPPKLVVSYDPPAQTN